ncbi:YkgJ family cysteine cluster protein [archaeon]|nr:YkgJ family cysteine cluster protein [archaeon]
MQTQTCCDDAPFVPLSIKDIERIVALGYKTEEFVLAKEYDISDYVDAEPWWNDSFIEIDGRHYRINVKKDARGHCLFLREREGCGLGKERPALCKIYPFWVYEGTVEFERGEVEECYACRKLVSVPAVMTALGENEQSIMSHFNEFQQDCNTNKEECEKILRRALGLR